MNSSTYSFSIYIYICIYIVSDPIISNHKSDFESNLIISDRLLLNTKCRVSPFHIVSPHPTISSQQHLPRIFSSPHNAWRGGHSPGKIRFCGLAVHLGRKLAPKKNHEVLWPRRAVLNIEVEIQKFVFSPEIWNVALALRIQISGEKPWIPSSLKKLKQCLTDLVKKKNVSPLDGTCQKDSSMLLSLKYRSADACCSCVQSNPELQVTRPDVASLETSMECGSLDSRAKKKSAKGPAFRIIVRIYIYIHSKYILHMIMYYM